MEAFEASIARSLSRTAVVRITLSAPPTGKRKQYDSNGEEMKNISEKFFGQEVAVVAQNASVFNKSIRDNVTFGKQHVSEEDIWQALEMVNLADTVRALPLGLNTIINNNGEN